MHGQTTVTATLILNPKGPADRKPDAKILDKILQMEGEAVARELPAEHQLIAHGWGHLSYMPYLVYMPEKDRLLLLYNSRETPALGSNLHPVLLRSDDQGKTWSTRRIVDAQGVPCRAEWGIGLAYLGKGKLTLDAAESQSARLFSQDYGETWTSVPIPRISSGFPWCRWDPCFADTDPVTGNLRRLLDTGYSVGMERQFSRARRVAVLPHEWHWRHDPEDRGLTEGWCNDTTWTAWPRMMRIDQHWTLQGEADGIAWYGTRFEIPEAGDAPLAIAFGAVDGYCDVFVDGSKVGEQKLAPEIMWNRPFHLPLEKRLSAGTHTLVIRVEKKCGTDSNAGIYLPVWVVEDHGRDRCAAPEPWVHTAALIRCSYDGGLTWPEEIEPPSWNGASGVGVNEVALCRAANGDLMAACRITHPKYYGEHDNTIIDHYCGLGVSLSQDNGYTWTNINVLYEYGRMHPSLVVLPEGTVVMTYVVRLGALKEEHRWRDEDGFSQWSVEAVVSRDHGVSWDLAHRYVLAKWSGAAQAQSTATVLLPDGSLLTACGSGYLSSPVKDVMAPTRELCLVHWRPLPG
jgi:hypothetical protein